MVRMTVNVTVKDMVRSTCKGTVKCMVVKGMVRGTVISTIKGIATIKFSHVSCLRENQTDRELQNKSIHTPGIVHPPITALRGRTSSTVVQRARCYLGPSDSDSAAVNA